MIRRTYCVEIHKYIHKIQQFITLQFTLLKSVWCKNQSVVFFTSSKHLTYSKYRQQVTDFFVTTVMTTTAY